MSRPFWLRGLGLGGLVVVSMLLGGIITAQVVDTDGSATGVIETGGAADNAVSSTSSDTSTAQPTVASAVPGSLADLVADARKSAVVIDSVDGLGQPSGGTGIVLDQDGHILTNYHVVQGQTNIKVILWDGTASRAEIVGTDPGSDLAIVQVNIPAHLLIPATLGDSDAVRVGDGVFAIGNPFAQKFTVTSGIVSAIGGTTEGVAGRPLRDVIQTDAAVNPGNSGGPLFNLKGEVIGINTSIENPSGRFFVGIGFAIPSNTVLRFLPQLMAGATIRHPQLGVSVQELDAVVAGDLGLEATRGLYVMSVSANSAAARAGIRARGANGLGGDVILSVNGEATNTFQDLARAIDDAEVGDVLPVVVDRAGQQLTLNATLQAWDLN